VALAQLSSIVKHTKPVSQKCQKSIFCDTGFMFLYKNRL